MWWSPWGRAIPDPARCYLATGSIDPFARHSHLTYDTHALLPIDAQDPLGNRTTVGVRDASGNITRSGYRVLSPV